MSREEVLGNPNDIETLEGLWGDAIDAADFGEDSGFHVIEASLNDSNTDKILRLIEKGEVDENGQKALPISEVLDGIHSRLNRAYFDAEGVRLISDLPSRRYSSRYGTRLDEMDEAVRKSEKTARKHRKRKRRNDPNSRQNKRKQAITVNNVIADALGNARPKGKETRQLTNDQIRNLESASLRTRDDLDTVLDSLMGTHLQKDVAMEFLRRIRTTEAEVPAIKVRKGYKDMTVDKLQSVLRQALEGGDRSTVDQVAWVMQYRGAKKRGVNIAQPRYIGKDDLDYPPLIEPKDSRVRAAIDREAEHFVGTPTHEGIPANAPAAEREMLSYLTHRSPEAQYSLRTLAYRMLRLMGKDLASNVQGSQILSQADLYKLAGKEIPDGAGASFMDFRAPEFSALRKDLRRLAIGLNKGESSPMDLMHEIGHLATRSLFGHNEQRFIHRVYAEANDPIKSRIKNQYKDKPEADQAMEWFVEGWGNYAAERVAKGDIWQARLSGSEQDLKLRNRFELLVDRLLEGVSYLVNGLVGREDVRQMYRRMTFFGDMMRFAKDNPQGWGESRLASGTPSGNADARPASQNYNNMADAGRYNPVPDMARIARDADSDNAAFNSITHQLPAMAQSAENSGAPRKLTQTLLNMARKRPPNEQDLDTIKKFNAPLQFRTNSSRIRKNSMNWIADWIAPLNGSGHTERTNSAMSGRIMPILEKFKELDDYGNVLKRYRHSVAQTQPGSIKRIFKALRAPEGSPLEARRLSRLNQKEREIYKDTLKLMQDEKARLTAMGVQMGNIKKYVPQLWNVHSIEKNKTEFIEAMADYFQFDSNKQSGQPILRTEAVDRARGVWSKLSDEEGIYHAPTHASSKDARSDHIDFQRMIRLDQAPGEILEKLEPFLEDNLEAVLVKYLDSSTRRADFHQQFGVGMHGLHDYINVVEHGLDGAAELLSTSKVRKVESKRMVNGDIVRETEQTTLFRAPFKNIASSMTAINKTIKLLINNDGNNNIQAARKYLLSFMPDENPHYKRRIEAIIHALADTNGGQVHVHNEEIKHLIGTFQALQHKPVVSNDPWFKSSNQASRWIRNFNSVSLLSYVTLTSLSDLALPLVRSGSMTSYLKAINNLRDPEYLAALRNIGTSIESLTHQRIQGIYGNEGGKWSNAFFNLVGLTQWTDAMRQVSGAVAWESFKAEQKRAQRLLNKNGLRPDGSIDFARQSKGFKASYSYLNHFGLADFAKPDAKPLDSLAKGKKLDKVREGVIRFANETIFTPNQDDIPLRWQTPWARVIAQFKHFPMMMGRLARQTVECGVKEGDWRQFVALVFASPVVGMGSLAVKDIFQSRGGDDGQSPEARHRNLLKFLGYDEDIHGNKDDFAGWYAEGLAHAGALGLLAQMTQDAAQQLDNGAYGFQRIAGLVGGPTVGLGADLFNVASGSWDAITKGEDNGNGKERQAVRSVAGRIPFIGQNMAVREWLTETIAGEPEKRGSKKSSWSTNWDSTDWDGAGWSESDWE